MKFLLINKKGFTLIELLVVISIIAVLTTLLMANFVGIRQRGRDGQRKSNVYSIQSALELYRADNGTYPVTDDFPSCGNPLSFGDIEGEITVYMQKVPCDPLGDDSYAYVGLGDINGTVYTYTLLACLENRNDSAADDPPDTDACDSTSQQPASFTLVNP